MNLCRGVTTAFFPYQHVPDDFKKVPHFFIKITSCSEWYLPGPRVGIT